MEQAGYSGTPLAKKLGIKEGFSIILYNQPEYYFKLFTDMPKNLEQLEKDQLQDADFIHLFCTSFEELKTVSERYKPRLKPNGLLWISWPKGTSGIKTDLKRDTIREYMLFIGLVDVKVAAIDNEWSGLKFVYRLKDRTQ
ncbi:MAG: DUF3052 domain-containing protein [Flavobacteriaceae bacterium]|nr:DUF3052 domain-containing protein [Flavobacteriaceae bacterium]